MSYPPNDAWWLDPGGKFNFGDGVKCLAGNLENSFAFGCVLCTTQHGVLWCIPNSPASKYLYGWFPISSTLEFAVLNTPEVILQVCYSFIIFITNIFLLSKQSRRLKDTKFSKISCILSKHILLTLASDFPKVLLLLTTSVLYLLTLPFLHESKY